MVIRFFLSILFLFYLQIGFAQNSLTLQQAIDIALQNSLEIAIEKNNVSAATILNTKGFAGALPLVTSAIADNEQITSVNQKLSTGNSIQRNNAAANTLTANVTGSIVLYNGGRIVATKKRLEQLQQLSSNYLNSQIQNVIAAVQVAYYDVIRQQLYIKTIDTSIAAINQQLNIVQTRQSVGLANNADLFQAQIDVNALLQAKQTQLVVIDQAKTELLRLLTLKTDSTVTITDSIVVEKTINLQTILSKLPQNSDVAAAADQIKINELIVKETDALRYPTIRAVTGYNFSRNQAAAGQLLLNQNYGPTVGLQIGIPIFNGGIFKKQTQVAKINVQNAVAQKQLLYNTYEATVIKQYQAYTAARTQYDSELINNNLAAKLLSLVLQRFQLRQATIIEVKNAQQSFEQSGYRLVNISFAAKAAEVELNRLAGILF